MLKGSGRSIPGLHLRDALAAVDAKYPGLITRFGGHAMAAGLTMPEEGLAAFRTVFDVQCRALLDADALAQVIDSDGELGPQEFVLDTAHLIESAGPWGQGFPEPRFDGEFEVIDLRPIGKDGNHVRYRLRGPQGLINAVHFNGAEIAVDGGRVRAVYQLAINRWQDRETLELKIEQIEAAS